MWLKLLESLILSLPSRGFLGIVFFFPGKDLLLGEVGVATESGERERLRRNLDYVMFLPVHQINNVPL